MIDLLTRAALLGLYGWVLWRSFRYRRFTILPARLRSLRVIAAGTIMPIVFWLDVLVTAPVTDGALTGAVWLSRVAFASVALALLTLQAFIRDSNDE